MKILVLMRMVPDIVEELEVAPDGRSLDVDFLRLIVAERDDHALEQALLLKDRHGGEVVVVAPDAPDVDDVLYTALAKGTDRVVKIGGVGDETSTVELAAAVVGALPEIPDLMPVDLVLTGSQTITDLDGMIAPLVADALGFPYVGLISGVEVDEAAGVAAVSKEYAGGVHGRFRADLPVVLGIQGAEAPPRYVPVAKVRAAMTSGEIAILEAGGSGEAAGVSVISMAKPVVTGGAEMLSGSPADLAERLAELLAERGLV